MHSSSKGGLRSRASSSSDLHQPKRMTTRIRSSSSQNIRVVGKDAEKLSSDPLDSWISKFTEKSRRMIQKSKFNVLEYNQAERALSRYGLQKAAAKDYVFFAPALIQIVLSHLCEDNLWDITLASQFIPRIQDVITDPGCISVCLEVLEVISCFMLDTIIAASEYKPRFGVDVSAEERTEQSRIILKSLRSLRDSANTYRKKMSVGDSRRFDQILAKLKNL